MFKVGRGREREERRKEKVFDFWRMKGCREMAAEWRFLFFLAIFCGGFRVIYCLTDTDDCKFSQFLLSFMFVCCLVGW